MLHYFQSRVFVAAPSIPPGFMRIPPVVSDDALGVESTSCRERWLANRGWCKRLQTRTGWSSFKHQNAIKIGSWEHGFWQMKPSTWDHTNKCYSIYVCLGVFFGWLPTHNNRKSPFNHVPHGCPWNGKKAKPRDRVTRDDQSLVSLDYWSKIA